MCTLKDFLTLLSGFLTPVIAALALMIAYRQYKIQEYRVRLDLYERRMKIYEAIKKFRSAIMRSGDLANDVLFTFLEETSQAKFLFKGEMERHIGALSKRGVELQDVLTQLNDHSLPVGPERTALAQQMKEHFQWLRDQRDKTDKLFVKYVKLDR